MQANIRPTDCFENYYELQQVKREVSGIPDQLQQRFVSINEIEDIPARELIQKMSFESSGDPLNYLNTNRGTIGGQTKSTASQQSREMISYSDALVS